jgi:hypothetical protein
VFRRQGYDGPYGRFDNGPTIGNVLGGILGGVIGAAVLRNTLDGGFHREPGPWDSDFGGGFPFPQDTGGDWTGGGSFDGGGSSGDGFDTGGSF